MSNETSFASDFFDALLSVDITHDGEVSSVTSVLEDFLNSIDDEEEVSSAIAETNAVGYSLDEYEVREILIKDGSVQITFDFILSGEWSADSGQMYTGDRVDGQGTMTIESDGVVKFKVVNAAVHREEHDLNVPDERTPDDNTPNG